MFSPNIQLILCVVLLILLSAQCIWLNNRFISQKQENLELFKRYTRIFYESSRQNDQHVEDTTRLLNKMTEGLGLTAPVYMNGERILLYDEVTFHQNDKEMKGWVQLRYTENGFEPENPFIIAAKTSTGFQLYDINEVSPLMLVSHHDNESKKLKEIV